MRGGTGAGRDAFGKLVLHNARNFVDQTTPSGLRVMVKEVASIPGVNVTLWYQAGGAHRPAGRSGLAHFLEHMVFKGTDRFAKGDVDLICDRNGGSNNAYTDLDHTYYVFNFACDRWEIALEILASQMSGCLFPPEEFEAERQVVIQERMLSEDDPSFLLEEAALQAALPESPYRFGVIGAMEDLRAVDREEMISFYRRYYRPENALLVITGDVETEQALAAVNRWFPGRTSGVSSIADQLPKVDDRSFPLSGAGGRRLRLRLPAQLPEIRINFPSPPMGHPDSYVLMVLNNLLSYGKNSRIYRRVIERDQLATEAWFSYLPCRQAFLMELSGQARPGVALERLEDALLDEIRLLCRERVDDEEIRKSQRQTWMNMLLAGQSLEDQSYLLGRSVIVGGLGYIDEFFTRLAEVDGEAIIETSRRLFGEEGRTVALLEPDSSGEGGGGETDG